MKREGRVLFTVCAVAAAFQWMSPGLAQSTSYSTAKPVVFRPGNGKVRDKLARIADTWELVEDRFVVALMDLDDDDRAEINLQSQSSAFCGSGGCLTLAIEQQGQRMVTLSTQNLDSSLAVTQERVGDFRALAAVDRSGAIAVADRPGTPRHGRQMVYRAGQARTSAATATQPTPEPKLAVSPALTAARRSSAPSVVGINIGMPAPEAVAILKTRAQRHAGRMTVGRVPLRWRGCPGCEVVSFDASIGVKGNGILTGEERDHSISLRLSPPVAGAKGIAVTRNLLLKNSAGRDAVLQQFRERHGQEPVLNPSVAIWFLDDAGRTKSLPRTTRFRSGENTDYACAEYPGKYSGYSPRVNNAEQLRAQAAAGRVNVESGTVLSVGATGGMTQQITVTLVDHRAVIAAAHFRGRRFPRATRSRRGQGARRGPGAAGAQAQLSSERPSFGIEI